MDWLEIAIDTTDAGTEAVCAALTGVGVDQVSIEESRQQALAFLNERAVYWDFADAANIGVDTPCVKAYLSDTPENQQRLTEVREAVARLKTLELGMDLGSLAVVVSRVCDADWENNWKAYYKPLPIGERLMVLPSWEPEPAGHERKVLRLDPGVAFGTGAHHTTRMCLEFLESCVIPGSHVLDMGCGSGILSIAARILGAKDAVAVDIDPIAERIAMENAALNGIDQSSYQVLIGDLLTDEALRARIAGQYDLICANIVADVIIRLSPLAKSLAKPGAPFLVSGVIDERRDEVLQTLEQTGFSIEAVRQSESWVAILARA